MAGAGSVRAGRAFVEFFGEDSKLIRTMKSLEKRLQGWGKNVTAIGKSVLGAGLAVLTPLLAATKVFDSMGSTLLDMSARAGAGVEALSSLGFAAEQSGASLEELEIGLKKQAKFLVEAAQGGKNQIEVLKRLGLTVNDLARLAPEDQFRLIASRLAAIKNPAVKAATAMEVFGKSGTSLLPMINDMKALEERAKQLGIIVSKDDAAAADTLGDAWGELVAVGKALVFQVGAALAPLMTGLITSTAEVAASAIRWVKENRELIVTVFKIAAGVAAVGAGIVALGAIFTGLGAVMGGIAAIISGIGVGLGILAGLFTFLVSPIGLVIVALTALGAWFFTATDMGSQALQFLADAFATTANDATKAFEGIRDALAIGDIGQAMTILGAFLTLQWQRVTSYFSTTWNTFLNWFVQASLPIAKRVSEIFVDMALSVVGAMIQMIDATQKALGKELIDPKILKSLTIALPAMGIGLKAGAAVAIDNFGAGIKDSTAASIEDAQLGVDEARKQFDDAVGIAAEKRKAFKPTLGKNGVPEVPDIRAGLEQAKSTVTGTFSAAAAKGIGGSRQLDEIVTHTKQTAIGIKKLAGKPQGIPVS